MLFTTILRKEREEGRSRPRFLTGSMSFRMESSRILSAEGEEGIRSVPVLIESRHRISWNPSGKDNIRKAMAHGCITGLWPVTREAGRHRILAAIS